MVLVVLQGTSALFFLAAVTGEILHESLGAHTVLEGTAIIALIIGAILGGFEIFRISRIANEADENLQRAQAEFSDLIRHRFTRWSLTLAEAEIGSLVLKGFDISEIADLRKTAQGTVRTQLSHIYDKSGYPSRGRFVSSFLDDLINASIWPNWHASAAQTQSRLNRDHGDYRACRSSS